MARLDAKMMSELILARLELAEYRNEENPALYTHQTDGEIKTKFYNVGFRDGLGEAKIQVGRVLEDLGLE